MAFTPEIKHFAKNTAIFALIFTLVIHFSWEYIISLLGLSASAYNDKNFENANITYMGNTATALSLRLGGASTKTNNDISIYSAGNIISIDEVFANPSLGQEKLISSNMLAINTYANILKTDIIALLDTASNRTAALDNHISLLKSYYIKTNDQLSIIADQKTDLNAITQNTSTQQTDAKNVLQNSYKNLEYSGVDTAISDFLSAKNLDTRAKIYIIYLDRFEKSYNALQAKNKKILDAIINNRDALINRSIVVIPDTGTDIIKQLGLIQSEADYKAQQELQ